MKKKKQIKKKKTKTLKYSGEFDVQILAQSLGLSPRDSDYMSLSEIESYISNKNPNDIPGLKD